jgi:glycosyltransferase involved in cell wall biosynthesis
LGYYFIFVNDGSTDNTLDLLQRNIQENFFILDLKANVGKAEAVRQGMMFFKTLEIYNVSKWVGFWDADLSTPLFEVDNFLNYKNDFYKNADAIFGSRTPRMGSNIKRSRKRYFFGRFFSYISKIFFNLYYYDSQCGAKVFKKSIVDQVFSKTFISRWAFDIEIILRLRGYFVVEYPLTSWENQAESKLNFLYVLFKLPIDFLKIKRKYSEQGIR